jgi:HEAT repeat protein
LVALGVSGDSVIDMLAERLNDLHGYVRVAAAEALGKLGVRGKKKIFDGLIKLLDDGYYGHYHGKYVRDAAFDALWMLAPCSTAEPVSSWSGSRQSLASSGGYSP